MNWFLLSIPDIVLKDYPYHLESYESKMTSEISISHLFDELGKHRKYAQLKSNI